MLAIFTRLLKRKVPLLFALGLEYRPIDDAGSMFFLNIGVYMKLDDAKTEQTTKRNIFYVTSKNVLQNFFHKTNFFM
jgi:hypothetical protein